MMRVDRGMASTRGSARAQAALLAGRLQQEAEALDWVTAEQKVTRPGTGDHDACG